VGIAAVPLTLARVDRDQVLALADGRARPESLKRVALEPEERILLLIIQAGCDAAPMPLASALDGPADPTAPRDSMPLPLAAVEPARCCAGRAAAGGDQGPAVAARNVSLAHARRRGVGMVSSQRRNECEESA
jgi:hypothetical protein